ncbi:MAG: C39 family peptidase [Silicimonas sp.]|jgi:ABC-type bacteriocin/lantibiotic exporter with double-glycine peptidase domain|nr:C39 family peptidase [Silicimonas sp.]
MLRILPIVLCLAIAATSADAKIPLRAGLTQPEDMPSPGKRRDMVMLDVPQVAQGKQPWCVPASVSMALAYYGKDVSPARLKQLAESHKHESQRNVWVTSWLDMQEGLRRIGAKWKIAHYSNTRAGFYEGLRDIKRSLDRKRPVLIDVDLLTGHTFVIVGYNDDEQVLYFRDPLLKDGRMRILSYWTIYENWHNRGLARTRSAFFTRP